VGFPRRAARYFASGGYFLTQPKSYRSAVIMGCSQSRSFGDNDSVAGLPRLRIKPRIIFNNLCKDFADNSLRVQLVLLESSLIAKLT
jgi:hypothetical protein